jgi:hypothetical protein
MMSRQVLTRFPSIASTGVNRQSCKNRRDVQPERILRNGVFGHSAAFLQESGLPGRRFFRESMTA